MLTHSLNLESFLEAIHSTKTVNGLTHNFYRYPARFSPLFPRGASSEILDFFDIIFQTTFARPYLSPTVTTMLVLTRKIGFTVFLRKKYGHVGVDLSLRIHLLML